MLRIVKATEPITVDRIVLCLYSQPGLGKSTLGFTSSRPLLLDADKGAHRASRRKDTVPVEQWGDIAAISAEDLKEYDTVIVDTAGRALDFLSAQIIKENPKMGRGGLSLTLQGFGELKGRFASWMKMLRMGGKDVVLICHMDEQRNGDDVIERLDVQGGSKSEIYKSADAMGRLVIAKDGKRYIDFNPRENSFGKNPCSLPLIPFDLDNETCLAQVIATIKDRLSAHVEVDKKAANNMQDWMTVIRECKTVDDLNLMLPQIRRAGAPVIALANKRAQELKLAWDGGKMLWTLAPRVKEHAVA